MRARWLSFALVAGVMVSGADVRAQGSCGTEICPSEPPPPPCKTVNEDFDDIGCPPDFDTNPDLEFCFDDSVPAGGMYPSLNGGDDQIFVLGNRSNQEQDCGIVRVKETGYYSIFDSELSESCADQLDETGYLTVHNTCNGEGFATTRNVGNRFLVPDQDNTGAGCTQDSDCNADQVCREGNNHGRCCVPAEPVFMGTFLLVAGEDNVICIHHWCPEWESLSQQDPATYEDVFVHDTNDPSNNCVSADSIHFKIAATTVACKEEGFLQQCSGGCENGECKPHPCYDADCPNFCRTDSTGAVQCIDVNPCSNFVCEHGCAFGLCLQGPDANGEDRDSDGFVEVADCDDLDGDVNPGASEVCDNGKDDDCNGAIDDCGGGPVFVDGGLGTGGGNTGGGTGTGASNAGGNGNRTTESNGGCGCRAVGGMDTSAAGLLGLWVAAIAFRLRRRWR